MNPFVPDSVSEAEAWLREQAAAPRSLQNPVGICGFASRKWLQAPPDWGSQISTRALQQVHWIDAEDRTCKVDAGIQPAELDQVLAEHNLCFAHSESWAYPAANATPSSLGGLLVGGVPSLSSAQLGLPRDQVLGATWLLADGTQIRSGARVVKSVAGYDLTRLLLGSRGQLALCVDITLRLRPRPKAVSWSEASPGDDATSGSASWLSLLHRDGAVQVAPQLHASATSITLDEAQRRLATLLAPAYSAMQGWLALDRPQQQATLFNHERLRDTVGAQSIWDGKPPPELRGKDARSWPPTTHDAARLVQVQRALVPNGHHFALAPVADS